MFKDQFDKEELRNFYSLEDRDTIRVRINFISSADGAVTLKGRSGALGTKTDQALMKVLRAMADVVLVGAGTVRAEGYGGFGLKPEDVKWRREHGLSDEPRMAIVTNSADLDAEMSVFQKAKQPPLVITHSEADASHLTGVAEIIVAGTESVDATLAVNELEKMGLPQILCEGGPHLFGSLLDAELAHEVCLTLAPMFVGGEADRISVSKIEEGRRYKLKNALHDADSMLYLLYSKV
ncbi:MAG TPA: pyrimidine reductase family protein [Microbacteriaceae bacterium]|nr:pyrimidine reductase family protein [Microbacteriaceae bacterium]